MDLRRRDLWNNNRLDRADSVFLKRLKEVESREY